MGVTFFLHGFGEFDSTRPLGPATWGYFDLLFIHQGEVELTVMKQSPMVLRTEQGVLLYPDTFFEGKNITSMARASVQHFALTGSPGDLPPPLGRLVGRRAGYERLEVPKGMSVERDMDRAVRLAMHSEAQSLGQIRTALLSLILATFTWQPQKQTPRTYHAPSLDLLLEWIEQNLHRPLSLGDLAQRVDLALSQFRAVFEMHTGTSPGRFLMQRRMDKACRLLCESVMPIKQIAVHVGYTQLSTFHRRFKEEIGSTPRLYRMEHRLTG